MALTNFHMNLYYWFFGELDPNEDIFGLSSEQLVILKVKKIAHSPHYIITTRFRRLWWYFKSRVMRTWNYIWHATLGPHLYVKWSNTRYEAHAMRFVASHTSIPLPRVWLSFPWLQGRHCIIMDRIHNAVELDSVWKSLSQESKEMIAEQLRGYMDQLRSIPAPIGQKAICSVRGGYLRCFRLHDDGTTGPFRDEDHMNLQLRHLLPLDDPRFPPVVQRIHRKPHPLVFTHNDFFPRNIMIDKDLSAGTVVAIMDWESAGWFPAHWEYCKSANWGSWVSFDDEWRFVYVPKMVPVFREEAEADRALMYDFDGITLNPVAHAT